MHQDAAVARPLRREARIGNFVAVADEDEILARAPGQARGEIIALPPLVLPRVFVRRAGIGEHGDPFAPARKAFRRRARKMQRFGIAAKRERRLAQHETIDHAVENAQAQLEQIELIEEREAVDDHRGSATMKNAASRVRSSVAASAIWKMIAPALISNGAASGGGSEPSTIGVMAVVCQPAARKSGSISARTSGCAAAGATPA